MRPLLKICRFNYGDFIRVYPKKTLLKISTLVTRLCRNELHPKS